MSALAVTASAANIAIAADSDDTATADATADASATATAAVPPPRLAAVRVKAGPVIDGRLDDRMWAAIAGTSDFTQRSPYGGAAPSERTTLKVAYDDDALYFAFDCQQTSTP